MSIRFIEVMRPRAAVIVVLCAVAAPLSAQTNGRASKYPRDLPAALLTQAKIPESKAAERAVAKVPKGHIQAVELEKESGRLIYSYELKVPGQPGVEEVNVNAKTGAVVNVEHESGEGEADEAKTEKKPAKKP